MTNVDSTALLCSDSTALLCSDSVNGQPREKIARYDLDNSGCINAEELEHAFDKLETLAEANAKGSVPFSCFPDDVYDELKAFDSDGKCLPSFSVGIDCFVIY